MTAARCILAIDTALNGCGVALLDGAACVQESRAMNRGHSEELMPMIVRVLQAGGVEFSDVDLIAVTVGPGAFTGLRIGLATAQGLGLALGIPVVGVTTLEAIARAYRVAAAEPFAVILDTKRADFYAQIFDVGASEPLALSGAALAAQLPANIVCIGDGAERFLAEQKVSARFVAGFEQPAAEMVARIAAERPAHLPPQPLYLRPPDVSVSKQNLRTLAADSLRDA